MKNNPHFTDAPRIFAFCMIFLLGFCIFKGINILLDHYRIDPCKGIDISYGVCGNKPLRPQGSIKEDLRDFRW